MKNFKNTLNFKNTDNHFLSKKYWFVLLFIMTCTAAHAQKVWDGSTGINWHTASNWTPSGVPDSGDDVIIPDVANDPVISGITAALAKSVKVETGGLLTINNGGSLTIDSSSAEALKINGTVNNDGILDIGQNGGANSIGNEGIEVVGGYLTNGSSGTINIDNTDFSALRISSGNMDNLGLINIGQNGGATNITSDGMVIRGPLNNDGGIINIDNVEGPGMSNKFGGNVLNSGILNIGQNGGNRNIEGFGILQETTIYNQNGGVINIDNTGDPGISSEHNFINEGTLNIGLNGGADNIIDEGIYAEQGTFDNKNGGVINIANTEGGGIFSENDGFTNEGTLNIGLNGGADNIGGDGIFADGTFDNMNGGVINIANTSEDGIYSRDFVFTNEGTLNIGLNGGADNIGGNGITVRNSTFDNMDGGLINIENTTGSGINNSFNGKFTNYACAQIFLYQKLEVLSGSSFFNNDGLLYLNTSESHNISDKFTNNGIVEDVQGGFSGGTNNDVIIAPFSFSCPLSDALQIGSANSFTILDEWFHDPALTNKAGNYDQTNNHFLPTNLSAGANTLYFTASDGSCTYDVSIEVTTPTVGTRTWNGSESTDWDAPCNWTPYAVPTSDDDVIIPDVTNDPVISGTTVALAKSVKVETGGFLTINNGGSLTIDNSSSEALKISGTVNNDGILDIGQNGGANSIGNEGIEVAGGYLTNGSNGTINIDNTDFSALGISSGNLDNLGVFNIGQNGGATNISSDGIFISGLLNNNGGTINIDNVESIGLGTGSGGNLLNSGILNIGQNGGNGNIGGSGIYQKTTIHNQSGGEINIDNTGDDGMFSSNNFSNEGTLNIGLNGGADNIGQNGLVVFNGTFDNKNGGVINIANTSQKGIFNTEDVEFTNEGILNIGLNGGAGNIGGDGIEVRRSTFGNKNGGVTNIDNTTGNGFFNSFQGEFTNEGTLNIGLNGGADNIGGDGIEVFKGTFDNKNGGVTNIDNTTGSGIFNSFQGEFTNHACARIFLYQKLNVESFSSFFNNDGLLYLNTSESHDISNTFTNNGIVEDVQGGFSGGINDEIIVAPTTSNDCQEVSPTFGLGTTVDFNILGIYTDANAAQSAGTYDVGTNTFTPTNILPQGTSVFYVKIEDPVGSCSRTVEWTVNSTSAVVTCYLDSDSDGYGDPAISQEYCETCGTGYVLDNTDCDDTDADEFPGQVWYEDGDGDNYSSGTTQTACERPTGFKTANELVNTTDLDCNDSDAAINPGAAEICDNIDNNCDGQTDEGVQTTFYADTDGDGFGDPAVTTMACSAPTGYVSDNADCDDSDANVNPLATETCNGIDDDCDGLTDTDDPSLIDNDDPVITCPANITVDNDPGICGATVSYTVTATDNCASPTVQQTDGLGSGSDFPVGVTTESYTATDASGNQASCSFTVTVEKTGDPDLFYAYTVIGFKEVKMKENTVLGGGVGVVNAGKKAKLEDGTMVTATNTFVMSPVLELDGGSQVTDHYQGQVDINLLPTFQQGSACGNDVDIPDNSAPVTLDQDCYGKIEVGKNVGITFSGHATVNVEKIELKEGASVFFGQDTDLLVEEKFEGEKELFLSNSSHEVWIYAQGEAEFKENSYVSCNLYTKEKLKVEKDSDMTGLFISEDKVESKEGTTWNWNPTYCPLAPPPSLLVEQVQFEAFAHEMDGQPVVDLNWLTKGGFGNGNFVVEKSRDGIRFEKVAEEPNYSIGTAARAYSSADPSPKEGEWLYRLKFILNNGDSGYSEKKRVFIELPDGYILYPNPASDQVHLLLKSSAGKPALLQIVNGLGTVVQVRQVEKLPETPLTFDLDGFRDGIYWLNIQVEGRKARTLKFVVAK